MKVKLFFHFPQYFAPEFEEKTGEIEVEEGITAEELLRKVKIGKGLTVCVNGRLAKSNQKLKENDIVSIFPLSVGG